MKALIENITNTYTTTYTGYGYVSILLFLDTCSMGDNFSDVMREWDGPTMYHDGCLMDVVMY